MSTFPYQSSYRVIEPLSYSLTPLPPSKEGVEKDTTPLLPAAGRKQSKEWMEMGLTPSLEGELKGVRE